MFNKILKLIKEEYVTSYKFPWTHDETDVFKNPTISDINHIKDNRGYFDKKLDFIELNLLNYHLVILSRVSGNTSICMAFRPFILII